jgi:hypothetical protein
VTTLDAFALRLNAADHQQRLEIFARLAHEIAQAGRSLQSEFPKPEGEPGEHFRQAVGLLEMLHPIAAQMRHELAGEPGYSSRALADILRVIAGQYRVLTLLGAVLKASGPDAN